MVTLERQKRELKALLSRREEIREGLREHFSLPVVGRDYKHFELLVDELDVLRKKIQQFRKP